MSVLVILLMAAAIAVQTKGVQNRVAEKLIATVNESFLGELSVGSVEIVPFNTVVLKDVCLKDPNPLTDQAYLKGLPPVDTMLFAGELSASFTLRGLLNGIQSSDPKKPIILRRLNLKDAKMYIVVEPRPEGRDYYNSMSRLFSIPEPPKVPQEKPDLFSIRKVNIENLHFRNIYAANDRSYVYKGFGINWDDIHFPRIDARIHDLKWVDSRMSATIDELSAVEQCGYHLTKGSARVRAGMGKTTVTNFKFIDPWSRLDLPVFTMTYANQNSFNEFIHGVTMHAKLNHTRLSMQTMAYLIGTLDGCPVTLDITEGTADGIPDDLSVKGLKSTDLYSGATLDVSGNIKGMASVQDIRFDFTADRILFDSGSLGRLIGAFSPGEAPDLSAFAPGHTFLFKGRMQGPDENVNICGNIYSDIGRLGADVSLKGILDGSNQPKIEGSVGTEDLDLGIITGERRLGPLTMKAEANADLTGEDQYIRINNITVDRLQALGYDYSHISGAGTIKGNSYSGMLTSSDDNLQFVFRGLAGVSRKTGKYKLNGALSINGANLKELGILSETSPNVNITGKANANFSLENKDRMDGTINIPGLDVRLDDRDYSLGDINIRSIVQDGRNLVTVASKYAKLEYNGSKPLLDVVDDMECLTTRKYLPALYEDVLPQPSPADFTLTGSLGEIDGLVNFILPQVHIYKGMNLSASLTQNGEIKASADIPSASYAKDKTKIYGRDVKLNAGNTEGPLELALTSSELGVGSDLKLAGVQLDAEAEANTYGLRCKYTDAVENSSSADIRLGGSISREDALTISANPRDSRIILRGCSWDMGESTITFSEDGASFNGFNLKSGNQKLTLDGTYNLHSPETLDLTVERLDLRNLMTMLGQKLEIDGTLDGNARVISPIGEMIQIDSKLGTSEITLGERGIGSFSLASRYDYGQKRLHIEGSGIKRGRKVINIKKIDYAPADTDIVAMVVVDSLEFADFQSLLGNAATISSGTLNGKITALGKLYDPDLASSAIRISDGRVKVGPTGVSYKVDGPMTLTKDSFRFSGLKAEDRQGGKGTINGGIAFKGGILDLGIDLDRLELVNKGNDGSAFYGDVFASGKVGIKGPLDNIHIDVDARTDKESRLGLVLAAAESAEGSNILTFRLPEKEEPEEDPIENFLAAHSDEETTADLTLDAKIAASPQLEIVINLDNESANVITARGNGDLTMAADAAKGTFTMGGDYIITSGNYRFSALRNMAARNFAIQDGSSISFNGDPMQSDLDVSAIYNVRTTLSSLISDTTSVSTRRNVECGIKLTDKLSTPKVAVSVNVPDLDATTKSLVESELNTEDKQYKQFVALLVTGNFVPNDQSGIVNNTNNNNMLFSNISSIMSNQMSDIIQSLGIPVDLGLSYQQNEGGKDVFDVAMSTKLFDDRVVVNGSVGNRRYSAQSDDSMVGDVDMEVKLDKSGQTRLKLFSHSADDYTSYLDNTQRNGVGVSWQKEFNSLKELFRGKKARQEEAPQQEEVEYNKLTITSDE